jgi:5-methylcytosine-specific restriction endonuclease McrA
MPNPDPKPGPKRSYAAKEAAHKKEFRENSIARWMENDGCCERCGHYVPMMTPAHHRVPAGKGGFRNNDIDNLETVCDPCHRRETENKDKHEKTTITVKEGE